MPEYFIWINLPHCHKTSSINVIALISQLEEVKQSKAKSPAQGRMRHSLAGCHVMTSSSRGIRSQQLPPVCIIRTPQTGFLALQHNSVKKYKRQS